MTRACTSGSKSAGKAMAWMRPMTWSISSLHPATAGSGDASAVTTAALSSGSFSMARAARRRMSTMRSAVVSPLGGRSRMRPSRSVIHCTCTAASRWSFDVKYR